MPDRKVCIAFLNQIANPLRLKDEKLHHLNCGIQVGCPRATMASYVSRPPAPPSSMLKEICAKAGQPLSGAVLFPSGRGVGMTRCAVTHLKRADINIELGGARGGIVVITNFPLLLPMRKANWCNFSSFNGTCKQMQMVPQLHYVIACGVCSLPLNLWTPERTACEHSAQFSFIACSCSRASPREMCKARRPSASTQ